MKKLITLLLALLLALSAVALAEEAKPVVIGELTKPGQSAEELTEIDNGKHSSERRHVYFDTFSSLLLALRAGQIDRAAVPECVAKYICDRNQDVEYTVARSMMSFSMVVAESETELYNSLNAAIATLTANGTIAALQKTYIDELAPDAEPEPAELPVIEGAKAIRVVVTGDLPPLDYMTADGQCAGFNVALLAAIGKEANINFELVSADSGARITMLTSGRADAIFWMRRQTLYNTDGSIHRITDEMSEGVLITDPYIEYPLSRVTLAGGAASK